MAHLDLANLRTTLLDDTQLAAVALHRTFAGRLPVSSGHLVVCDPLVQAEAPALADYTAPLGRHPVEIIVHSGRPALAVVWFKPREALTASALHWQMARWTTQDLTGLDEDSFIGYPVDAGIGCFMDTNTQQALLALIERADGDEDKRTRRSAPTRSNQAVAAPLCTRRSVWTARRHCGCCYRVASYRRCPSACT